MRFSFLLAPLLTISGLAFSHDYQTSRPDAHAPISVMGDHTHSQGEWMLSYRFMQMNMQGMQQGKDNASKTSVLSQYNMYGDDMQMDMHMFGIMYAPTNSTTLMLMANYLENTMSMTMNNPMMMGPGTHKMEMESSGLGDTRIGALQNIYHQGGRKLHLNLMLSLPTGSINEKTTNMMGNKVQQSYAMQLGSGTYDLLPGVTYVSQFENFSWGAQLSAVIRLDENSRDYTLGNRYQAQTWLQVPVHQNVSISGRLNYQDWQEIDGKDSALDMAAMMNPMANANFSGGNSLSAGLGVNLTLPRGNRLALEYDKTLEQDLNGLQMALDNTITAGWQLSF